jgi:head-tail adaptor
MITTADLSWMQGVQNSVQPGTVTIERKSLTADGMGGYTESWTTAGTATGRIYPQERSAIEANSGGQVMSALRWWFTAPVGTDVRVSDRIGASDRTYEVESTNNDESYQTAFRASLVAYNEEERN